MAAVVFDPAGGSGRHRLHRDGRHQSGGLDRCAAILRAGRRLRGRGDDPVRPDRRRSGRSGSGGIPRRPRHAAVFAAGILRPLPLRAAALLAAALGGGRHAADHLVQRPDHHPAAAQHPELERGVQVAVRRDRLRRAVHLRAVVPGWRSTPTTGRIPIRRWGRAAGTPHFSTSSRRSCRRRCRDCSWPRCWPRS